MKAWLYIIILSNIKHVYMHIMTCNGRQCWHVKTLGNLGQFYTIVMESYKERIVSAWQDINIGAEFNLSASMTKNGDKQKQLDVDLASRAIKPRIALSRYYT